MNTISGVAQATGASTAHPYEGAGELAAALDELMVTLPAFIFETFGCGHSKINIEVYMFLEPNL